MKVLYDAYTNGNNFVLEVSIKDKGDLPTDKIFIHKSTTDEFIKVATLAELQAVPENRGEKDYYRKSYVIIQLPTVIEADVYRKLINDQLNSLATEVKSISEFYSQETEIEYPLQKPLISDIDNLYAQYKQLKEERINLEKQRDSLKSKLDTIKADRDYIKSIIDPILPRIESFNAVSDLSPLMAAASLLKVSFINLFSQLQNIKVIKTYASNDLVKDIRYCIAEEIAPLDQRVLSLSRNFYEEVHPVLTDVSELLSKAADRLSDINIKADAVIDAFESVSGSKVYKNADGTTTLKPISPLDDSNFVTMSQQLNIIQQDINEGQSIINTMAVLINSILDKYNKDVSDLNNQIMSINSQIDMHNRALDELKSQILAKDPNFNVELF